MQLMHEYVQKSIHTTFPRNAIIRSGGEFTHDAMSLNSGAARPLPEPLPALPWRPVNRVAAIAIAMSNTIAAIHHFGFIRSHAKPVEVRVHRRRVPRVATRARRRARRR